MDSAIDLTFKRLGNDLNTITAVASDQHPGPGDISWDLLEQWLLDIGKGVVDGLGGNWGNLLTDVRNFFNDLTKGENVSKAVRGNVVIWQGGLLDPPVIWPDEVSITYRAWSDDDLTDKSRMQVSAVGLACPPAADKGPGPGDSQHYQHTFATRLDTRGPCALVVAAGAGDTGWLFNVEIATVLVIILTPAVRQLRHSGFLLQSNFGKEGNFELAVPAGSGGLDLYWRNNDAETLPWAGPLAVVPQLGTAEGVSMIQAAWGTAGLGALFAVATADGRLWATGRPDAPPFSWAEPELIEVSSVPATGVHGAPALIQSSYGPGNLELFVPDVAAGVRHYWRIETSDADEPFAWQGPERIAEALGHVDGVAVCQSTLGTPGIGNFELVVSAGGSLFFLERQDVTLAWSAPAEIVRGVRGVPAIIRSRFGANGNLEVVVPASQGGLVSTWRDNDPEEPVWGEPQQLAPDLGIVDAVSLIQSTFHADNIGNFELAACAGSQITMLWRTDTALQWQIPQPLRAAALTADQLEQAIISSQTVSLAVRQTALSTALPQRPTT